MAECVADYIAQQLVLLHSGVDAGVGPVVGPLLPILRCLLLLAGLARLLAFSFAQLAPPLVDRAHSRVLGVVFGDDLVNP